MWEYQWSNFIYNCMSTFLHYVHCKDALLDCSAPGGERCESLTWVDEIENKSALVQLVCHISGEKPLPGKNINQSSSLTHIHHPMWMRGAIIFVQLKPFGFSPFLMTLVLHSPCKRLSVHLLCMLKSIKLMTEQIWFLKVILILKNISVNQII